MSPVVSYVLMIVAGALGYQWCAQLEKKSEGLPETQRRLLRTMRWAGIAMIVMGAALALRLLLVAH
jgi:hypothetical protein